MSDEPQRLGRRVHDVREVLDDPLRGVGGAPGLEPLLTDCHSAPA